MQFTEQFLQKSHLPHSLIMVLTFSVFSPSRRFSSFLILIRVKKGQGKAAEASGFRETVVEADEHLMKLLNPPET